MKRKLSGSATATVAVFIASGMLASVLGVRQINRISTDTAWVAAYNLPAGQVIGSNMLKQARIASDEKSITNSSELLGKKLRKAKKSGESFQSPELAVPPRQWLSDHVPAGRVLYTLPKINGGIPWNQLRQGDRLDVIARGKRGVRMVASNVNLVGALRSRARSGPTSATAGAVAAASRNFSRAAGASALVVAVEPQSIYPLASISEGDAVSLVLHGDADVSLGNQLSVLPRATHREVEVVYGLSRSTVLVEL